jgi:hypothetical protein
MVEDKMSNKIFTEKEIRILSRNQYIKRVGMKGINYTDEFKRIFISEYEKGRFPRDIFEEYRFDINIIGMSRVNSAARRWRASYEKDGIYGLGDARKENSGRPRKSELSIEEKYARIEAQNRLLKAEIELLKKIDILERKAIKKK